MNYIVYVITIGTKQKMHFNATLVMEYEREKGLLRIRMSEIKKHMQNINMKLVPAMS